VSTPRKHHYLPQFYLRSFSEDRKRICQIEKESLRHYFSAIKNTAAIRDFHELDHSSFDDPNGVEKSLAEIESQLAVPFQETIRDGVINSKRVHQGLIEMVSLLRMRVPAKKAMIEKSLEQFVRSTGLMMERNGKLPLPPKGFEDTLKMEKLKITINNWIIIQFMFQLASDEDILNLLYKMTPSILIAPQESYFFTCDQPVAVFNPMATVKDVYGTGIVHPKTEISLPLSSKVLLFLSWNDKERPKKMLSQAEVHEFNRRTIIMANSLVFTSQISDQVLEMVEKYGKFSAGDDLDCLDSGKEILHVLRSRVVMLEEQYEAN
jgi:hypothetical protein